MNNFISIGSCLSYRIGNYYKTFAQANFLSSTRHNRIDKIVDVYLENNKPELSYSYLSEFKFQKDSPLDLRQQIDNQFSSRSLGKTFLHPDAATGLTDIIENPNNINLIIYDTFGDLLFKSLLSKKDKTTFFFNIKYSDNWQDYFEMEEDRISIESIILYYTKLIKYFHKKNQNIKIIFINFPLFHHHNCFIRDRVEKINYAFTQNSFLQNNSFFIPAMALPDEHIDREDINHFKDFDGRSVYSHYAKIVKLIMDNYFDNYTWQKINLLEEKSLMDKLDEIMIMSETNNKQKIHQKNINIRLNSQQTSQKTTNITLDKLKNMLATDKENTIQQSDREFALTYFNEGKLLENEGKIEEAITNFKKVIEIAPKNSIEVYKKLDQLLDKRKDQDEFLRIYQRAVQYNPDNYWFHKRLGDILQEQDRLEEAISSYKKAIAINSSFSWAYKKLGQALEKKGNSYLNEAITNYQKAAQLTPKLMGDLQEKIRNLSRLTGAIHENVFRSKEPTNFDIGRKIHCPTIEDIKPIFDESAVYEINHQGVIFEIFTHFRENSPLLHVFGQGAVSHDKREKYGLPLFQRWSWAADLPYSVIVLNDPTIYMDNLEVGWFQGTQDKYYLPIVCELIQVFLDRISLKPKDVIFSGSSAGGFTSLMMAPSFPGSSVFVNNPQTDIRKYRQSLVGKFLDSSFPGISIEDVQDHQFDERFSVIEYYRSLGYVPNICYVQNSQDILHMKYHYIPFITEINKLLLENKESQNGCFCTEIYNDDKGHSPLSRREFISRLNQYSENILSGF